MRFIREQLRCGLQSVVQGFHTVDRVLRPGGDYEASTKAGEPPESTENQHRRVDDIASMKTTAWIVCLVGPLYGIAMGSYAWVDGYRSFSAQTLQMLYSGLKLPLLITTTVIIGLPSFYVLNTLFGLREDFREAVRAVVFAQAGLVTILASLTPLTLFFYLSNTSTSSYSAAILFNAFMFAVASISAQRLLASWYEPLIKKNPRHRSMMAIWIFVYAFVGIQMGYVLRPFIGDPTSATTFLRENPFQNAYMRVFYLVQEVVGAS